MTGWAPCGAGLDEVRRIYVADTANDRIVRMNDNLAKLT